MTMYICMYVDACEIPSPPGNGSINNASDVAAGDVISVTCSGGFVLFGDSNLTCLDDGFWSGGVGSCESKPMQILKCGKLKFI